jgi:ligand-binding sensor domain-containing protein/DNA-binding CsgD family transcriptional regulator
MMKRTAFRLLGLVLLGASAFSGSIYPGRFHRFERLTPKTGATSVIGFSSICQDEEGFLWVGTSAGLARYDGYRFVHFAPAAGDQPSPPPMGVYPVTITRSGDIWMGTSGNGLFMFSRETGNFVRYNHDAQDRDSLSDDIVLAVQEDAKGDLWVGTRTHGLSRFDRNKRSFVQVPLGPNADVVWDVLADTKGNIWVGTLDAGLFKIDPQTGNTVHFRPVTDDPRSLGSDNVWTVFEDREGTIWAGTKGGGLNRYVPGTNGFVRFYGAGDFPRDLASQTITAIAEDRGGRLWLGTVSEGLRVWDRTTGEYIVCKNDPQDPESLGDDNVTSIFEDAAGVIWVGTVRGGLNKCLTGTAKFEHYKHNSSNPRSLAHNDVRSLWSDGSGALWAGTKSGLERIDAKAGQVTRFLRAAPGEDGSSETSVLALLGDPRGAIWAGTEGGGLVRLDPVSGTLKRYRNDPRDPNSLSANRVNAIWADAGRPDVLWVGTHRGLNKFETVPERWTRFLNDPQDKTSLSGNIVTAIYGGKDGFLWVGTRWGLNRLNRATGEFVSYISRLEDPPGTRINDNIVNCIHESRAGLLWVGTDSGLNRFDRAKSEWRVFAQKDGLAGEVVCAIREDPSGALWISTNRGLSKFDPEPGIFTNFGDWDGLQGKSFNTGASSRGADGRLFFGGANGFNCFDPADVRKDTFVPPVVWTALRRNNAAVSLPRSLSKLRALTLPYKAALNTFEFAALSFAAPEMNILVYRLEPRAGDWIPLDPGNSLSLSELGAGEYTLRVKSANPDGVWNDKGLAIAIKVPAPFWRTWWFLLLAAAFIASGVVIAVMIRKKIRSSSLATAESLDGVIETYGLTAREQEILRLVLQGSSNKDIERKLFISASTVRNHIYNIYQKLGVRSRLELINRIAKNAREARNSPK